MNLQRGAPCWSTQIIRIVRSSCSLISSRERSAACRWSASRRSNWLTKPCLPTPRSTLIDVLPWSVVAEDETGPDRHETPVGCLREDQREQRVVVGVDTGRHHVTVEMTEPPHRVGHVVAVDGEGARPVDVAEVDLSAEGLVDLAQRLQRLDALVELVLEEAPSDLAVRATVQPVCVVRTQRCCPVEEAVVTERELSRPAERLGVGVLHGRELVGPAQVDEVATGRRGEQVAALRLVDVAAEPALDHHLAAVTEPRDAPAEPAEAVDLEGADQVVDVAVGPRFVPAHGEHLAHLGSLLRPGAGTQMSGARQACRVARSPTAEPLCATVRV